MRKLSYITVEKTHTILCIVFLKYECTKQGMLRISGMEEKDKDEQKTLMEIIQEIEEYL